MIQDPSGLLERVPELRGLCDDARVRAAVERGDPFAVYRALVLGRLTGRLRQHRDTVRTLLGNRRLFARPMKEGSGPFLGTFNGFGATLMGAAEKDGTTQVATHVAVALFFIPLFPFGAYVVSPEGGGPMNRSWRLYARVPLTLGTWLWQRTLSIAALVAVIYAGYDAFHATQHHVLHVLNGLNEPVHVTLDKTTLHVPPGGRQVIDLPVGTVRATAKLDSGTEVDDQQIRVRSGSQKLVWNVAGAAPLILEAIRYTSDRAPAPDDPGAEPTIYCGQRVLSIPDVDFAFVDPPSSISMPRGGKVVVRQRLAVAPLEGSKGVDLCVGYLMSTGKLKEVFPLLELAARSSGWDPAPTWTFLVVAGTVAPDRVMPLVEGILRDKPDSAVHHRMYQTLASFRMSEADLLARYRARAEAAPESAEAQYLYVRLLRGPKGLEALQAGVARFPDSPDFLRFLVGVEAGRGRWKQAQEAWDRLSRLAPDEAGHVLDEGITSLVALGRVPEARSQLLERFPQWQHHVQARAAVLDARLASLTHASDADRLVKKLEGDTRDAVMRVRAGLSAGSEASGEKPLVVYQRTVLTEPGKVPAAASTLPPMAQARLSDAEWALSWCECVRLDDRACRQSLERGVRYNAYDLAALARFVRGESPTIDVMALEPTVRAAAHLVRSRNPSLAPAERERLVAEARHADWVHDQITDALPAWTRPAAR